MRLRSLRHILSHRAFIYSCVRARKEIQEVYRLFYICFGTDHYPVKVALYENGYRPSTVGLCWRICKFLSNPCMKYVIIVCLLLDKKRKILQQNLEHSRLVGVPRIALRHRLCGLLAITLLFPLRTHSDINEGH